MANSRQLADELAALTRERSSDEVFHEAQAWRIPFGLIPTLAEALDLLPHRERDYMLEFDHPRAGHVRMPGIPWLFGDERPTRRANAAARRALRVDPQRNRVER